jgi:hypothetical protein
MTRTRPVPVSEPSAPSPLRSRVRRGVVEGGAFGLYLFLGLVALNWFEQRKFLPATPQLLPRAIAFVLGLACGGALLQGLKPSVRSIYGAMLLFMVCLIPTLLGTGILMAGWRPAALFLLVLTVPLGAALGFIDWNHLYRHARARRIPPAA